jgi:hypothetical protein
MSALDISSNIITLKYIFIFKIIFLVKCDIAERMDQELGDLDSITTSDLNSSCDLGYPGANVHHCLTYTKRRIRLKVLWYIFL